MKKNDKPYSASIPKRAAGVRFYGDNLQRADELAAQPPYHGDRSRLINDLIEKEWAKHQRKQQAADNAN